MLAVNLYYNAEIPAPYTPRVKYVFIEKDGVVQQLKQWNECDYPGGFYETANALLRLLEWTFGDRPIQQQPAQHP